SCTSVFGIVATVGLSMFPFIIPSSTHLASSLLIWDSSSTQQTLNITLIASVILIPLIIVYSSWVYYVLSEKVTIEDLEG
ncbi:MAG TPA: cytochrome d ubiquinol oxidase subunit II, partial [Gammaproteobacteria bacterium]|nr:cytochrome d ubiquinol oxidase subunit II [Gammaproteobacteria bacterium]